MTLPNLSPQPGEPSKIGWAAVAENLRHLASEALEVNNLPDLSADLAELAARCEALAAESYPCDLSVLKKRKKQARLERELIEVS